MSYLVFSRLTRLVGSAPRIILLAAFICVGARTTWSQTAAPAPAAPAEEEPLKLNELVVTGSVTPTSRLNLSLAVTTLDPDQIQVAAPRSTAEMLKLIPGIYTEASGGEVGNNVVVRGVATGGGVSGWLYIALQEDGLPVWSESNFRFTQADTFVRVTNFVDRIEALRGGSSGIFASSDPLGIVNLITREGSQELHGEYKLETGDFGLFRNEAWISGPINSSTTFAVGGFYRIDDGIRQPGYIADKGGQIMGNVKFILPNDKGYIKVSAKLMNDNPEFQLPFPLETKAVALGGTVQPATIPGGPDMRTAAIGSPDVRIFNFPGSPIGPINFDLADGESANYGYLGTDIEYHLTDTLKLKMLQRYSAGTHKEIRDSFGTPDTLMDIVDSLATNGDTGFNSDTTKGPVTPTVFAGALVPGSFTTDPNTGAKRQNYNFKLTYPGQAGAAATSGTTSSALFSSAAGLNGNGLGVLASMTDINMTLKNYQNDVRLTKTFNDGTTSLTGGFYYSYFSVALTENVEQELFDISKNGYHRLDVTFLNNDATNTTIGKYTYNGISQLGTTYINSFAEKREIDWFADLTQKIGSLTLDVGYRYLKAEVFGWAEAPQAYDGNTFIGNPGGTYPVTVGNGGAAPAVGTAGFIANASAANTNNGSITYYPALRHAIFGGGNTSSGSDSKGDHAVTAGANYVFPDHHTAVSARFSRSPKMIYTNDILLEIPYGNGSGNNNPTAFQRQNTMTQYELGLKYSRRTLGVYLTGFLVKERNVAVNDTVFNASGALVAGPLTTLDEDVPGVELEGIWAPVRGLTFSVHGTYQDPVFVGPAHFKGLDPVTLLQTSKIAAGGLQPQRIPKEYGNLSVSYTLPETEWGTAATNLSYQYTGKRAADQANTEYFAAFSEIAIGASFTTKGGSCVFRVQMDNALNSKGITEGDPRSTSNSVANLGALWGNYRPVMPRSVVASATYKF